MIRNLGSPSAFRSIRIFAVFAFNLYAPWALALPARSCLDLHVSSAETSVSFASERSDLLERFFEENLNADLMNLRPLFWKFFFEFTSDVSEASYPMRNQIYLESLLEKLRKTPYADLEVVVASLWAQLIESFYYRLQKPSTVDLGSSKQSLETQMQAVVEAAHRRARVLRRARSILALDDMPEILLRTTETEQEINLAAIQEIRSNASAIELLHLFGRLRDVRLSMILSRLSLADSLGDRHSMIKIGVWRALLALLIDKGDEKMLSYLAQFVFSNTLASQYHDLVMELIRTENQKVLESLASSVFSMPQMSGQTSALGRIIELGDQEVLKSLVHHVFSKPNLDFDPALVTALVRKANSEVLLLTVKEIFSKPHSSKMMEALDVLLKRINRPGVQSARILESLVWRVFTLRHMELAFSQIHAILAINHIGSERLSVLRAHGSFMKVTSEEPYLAALRAAARINNPSERRTFLKKIQTR